ncbi:MAG: prephenate dehydratase [Acidobacteriota bacterium]|jgi:prephenate dehydratase|nr:prephenate dehydratase [Acidobacteriota bacterium]
MTVKTTKTPPRTKVAIQGELGSFSHQASLRFFGAGIEPLHAGSFERSFEAVARKEADFAVIPIENSLAGSIHKNFDLLARHSLEIVAETSLRIEHSLIACPGVSLRHVRRIYSHPVALEQCTKLLGRMKGVERFPYYDTAGSVKFLSEQRLADAAAIASVKAAGIYGMNVLKSGIEDDPENYTRFLALARRGGHPAGGDKTSVVFGLRNEPGILFKALSVFALRNIDLSKIESRPIRGTPWQYLFYLDLGISANSPECRNALRHLRELTLYFKVLGSYSTV